MCAHLQRDHLSRTNVSQNGWLVQMLTGCINRLVLFCIRYKIGPLNQYRSAVSLLRKKINCIECRKNRGQPAEIRNKVSLHRVLENVRMCPKEHGLVLTHREAFSG